MPIESNSEGSELLTIIFSDPAHLAPLLGAAIGVFGVFGAVIFANKLEADKERRRAKNLMFEDLLHFVEVLSISLLTYGRSQLDKLGSDGDKEALILKLAFLHCDKSCVKVLREIRISSHFLSGEGIKHFRLARTQWELLGQYNESYPPTAESSEEFAVHENFILKTLSETRRDFARVAEDISGKPLSAIHYEVFKNLSDPKFKQACEWLPIKFNEGKEILGHPRELGSKT